MGGKPLPIYKIPRDYNFNHEPQERKSATSQNDKTEMKMAENLVTKSKTKFEKFKLDYANKFTNFKTKWNSGGLQAGSCRKIKIQKNL